MKKKFIDYYMNIADVTANLSYAKRLKVGALIVKGNQVLGTGYNGMPSGWENVCEYLAEDGSLVSKPEVLHAERNALDKLARSGGVGAEGAIIFCTHAPCLECAKSIYGAGITEVYYREDYRSEAGISFLKNCNVIVRQVPKEPL